MNKKTIKTIAATCAVVFGIWLLGTFLGVGIKSSLSDGLSSQRKKLDPPNSNYIAVVYVNGTIQNAASDPLSTSPQSYNHGATLSYINTLKNDSNNTGIFLEINTPGGGVYETDALYLALMEYKEETGRPIWAYMHNQAFSGGFYVAMSADKIIANRNTLTGSIGVIMTHTDYSGLYDKLGIQSDYITSGPNKAMGASDKPLSGDQRAIYQSIVDESYEQFVDIICLGREMDRETVVPLADGRIYTAQQAYTLSLIDKIADHDEVFIDFCTNQNSTYYAPDLAEYSFVQRLFAHAKEITPKTEAESMLAIIDRFQAGVPLYIYPSE